MSARRIAALLPSLAVACTDARQVGPGLEQPADQLTVTTDEASYTSSTPAVLQLKPPSLELKFSAQSGTEQWHTVARLEDSALQDGSASLVVEDSPDATGTATIATSTEAGMVFATAGSLSVTLKKGAVSGSFTAMSPATMNGSFEGSLLVECWVPKSALGADATAGGTISDGGTEALVSDETLASAGCQVLSSFKR